MTVPYAPPAEGLNLGCHVDPDDPVAAVRSLRRALDAPRVRQHHEDDPADLCGREWWQALLSVEIATRSAWNLLIGWAVASRGGRGPKCTKLSACKTALSYVHAHTHYDSSARDGDSPSWLTGMIVWKGVADSGRAAPTTRVRQGEDAFLGAPQAIFL